MSQLQRSSLGSLGSAGSAGELQQRAVHTPKVDGIKFDHMTGKLLEVQVHRDLTADRGGDVEERSVPRRERLTLNIEGGHAAERPNTADSTSTSTESISFSKNSRPAKKLGGFGQFIPGALSLPL